MTQTAKEIGKEIHIAEKELINLGERIKNLRRSQAEQQLVENRQVKWRVVRRIDGEVIFGPRPYDATIRFLTDMLGMSHMQPDLPDERGSFVFTRFDKQSASHFMEIAPNDE